MRAAALSAALAFTLVTSTALAGESMRCGKWVLTEEATIPELLQKCGDPAEKKITSEDIRRPTRTGGVTAIVGTTTTERWIYARGSRAFRMVVTIVDGRIRSIDRER